jgi:hypothetical protein
MANIRSRLSKLTPKQIAIRLFLTCWLVYGLHFATNTVREIYPALSLGDHFSFDVSEYLGLHPDIFELPGRGAFINNNPGASILGAIPYAITRPVIQRVVDHFQQVRAASGQPAPEYHSQFPMAQEFYQMAYERGLDVKFGLAAGVMQFFLMAPLSALGVVVMFYVLLTLTGSNRKAGWLAILYAFATPLLYRTAQLNQNILQAHFAFFAFVLLWQPWKKSNPTNGLTYILAGLLTGYTLVLDYSGLVIIMVIGLYVLARQWVQPVESRSWKNVTLFSLAVGVNIAFLLGYQWIAFGNPIFPAQHYMPPTTYSGYGFNGMDWPQLDLLWENAFGMRYGLFLSAPFLILALYFPSWFPKQRKPGETGLPLRKSFYLGKMETIFILGFTLAFFLFTAANQFSRMQFNSGVRHVVPVTPFVFLLAAQVLLRLPTWLAVIFGAAATYWSWCLAMYRDVELGRGIFESIIQISTTGPRLPWLETLKNLGLVPNALPAWFFIGLAGILIFVVWGFPFTGGMQWLSGQAKDVAV